MDVVLCAFRVVQKRRGKERVGVCGRGKYPGAPPHHQRKKREKLVDRKERYLPAKELRPGKTEITRTSTRTKWRLCSGRFEIQTERSDLSLSGSSFGVLRGLIRRFCCRCGRCWLPERRGSARILSGLWSSSAGREREGQEREDSQERFSQKTVTYLVDVRFFLGGGGRQKVRDSQDPEIPIQLGFPMGRYPARNGGPHSSSDGHRRLRENPEDRCDQYVSLAGAKRKKKNEEKPTRKTQREGKLERINDNDKRTGWRGIGKKGHEQNSRGYFRGVRVMMVHPQALVEPMDLPLRPNRQKRGNERNGIFEP
ncbi:hypothetical protein GEV33_015295 [Tenebrio molitor]|uniref:Uncharacterized protein n=1 Tax=Tenebrio molitor TaxID=7067 RepID=A0A8J6H4C6_TENMO|nr:hypothetical protein GEV33_015295 [Tenebrio molitor]